MRKTTLCLLVKGDSVLLAMKKRGFGAGKWNGVGGKVEAGESVCAGACREIKEEIGVTASEDHMEPAGQIRFYFENKPEWNQEVHLFLVRNWAGEPGESEEMLPKWYSNNEIPFSEMWADDPHWMPLVLAGKKVDGEFYFNEDGSEFKDYKIKEI